MTDHIHEMSDEALSGIAGGMSKDLAAAYDVMNGKYGNGEDRKRRLADAGYDYWTVQNLVNGLAKGYDTVARDVINGKYGNDQARINALRAKGYDPAQVRCVKRASQAISRRRSTTRRMRVCTSTASSATAATALPRALRRRPSRAGGLSPSTRSRWRRPTLP